MKGTVRAKGRCVHCGGAWAPWSLLCDCGRWPGRGIYVDLSWGSPSERIRLYSDERGNTFQSARHAQRTLEGMRLAIDQGIFDPADYVAVDARAMRWPAFCRGWIEHQRARVRKGELAEKTFGMYKSTVDTWLEAAPQLKSLDVRNIRPKHLQDFSDSLDKVASGKKPLSVGSIGRILVVLRLILRYAFDLEVLHRCPKMPDIPEAPRPRRAPQADDRDRIFALFFKVATAERAPGRHRAIFEFLRLHPLRPGEACAITWGDFFEAPVLRGDVFTGRQPYLLIRAELRKDGPSYSLPVHPDFLPTLRSLPRLCPTIFARQIGDRPARPYTTQALDLVWSAALRPLGIKQTIYECSRHFIATEAANRGEDIGRIAAALGNTVATCAKTYVKYRPEALMQILVPRSQKEAAPDA